jgi:hypothetical protein
MSTYSQPSKAVLRRSVELALRAGVRMCHQADEAAGAPGDPGHLEGVEDHLGAHIGCDPPADDPP